MSKRCTRLARSVDPDQTAPMGLPHFSSELFVPNRRILRDGFYIGVGKFRILGGQGLEYWGGGGGGGQGGQGGPNSQQAHDVVMTSCAQ